MGPDAELALKFIEALGDLSRQRHSTLWAGYCELSGLERWPDDIQLSALGKLLRELAAR